VDKKRDKNLNFANYKKPHTFTHLHTPSHTYTHLHTPTYMSVSVYVCNLPFGKKVVNVLIYSRNIAVIIIVKT